MSEITFSVWADWGNLQRTFKELYKNCNGIIIPLNSVNIFMKRISFYFEQLRRYGELKVFSCFYPTPKCDPWHIRKPPKVYLQV